MVEFLEKMHPVNQALLAGLFTWLLTALGAATIFFTRQIKQAVLDGMLGFAAGVMIAASIWSLLIPAIDMSAASGGISWLPATFGFILGALCMRGADWLLPHLHLGYPMREAEGIRTSWHRATLLVMAITLHNIPEGLAVGVAFGAVAVGLEGASLGGAIALAVGIALQNFPEGLAVAAPLRREGVSPLKSFWYGQLSAVVEPVFAVIGAATVLHAHQLLPYALGFAAGAMIFVVVEEVIPESQRSGNTDLATGGTILGFVVMMVLDVALG
jgi:zinc transporter, ZIP family